MMMKTRIAGVELIGKEILVTHAANPLLEGIEGVVVDETRNTIKVMTGKEVRILPKDQVTMRVGDLEIDGKEMIGRIEERIKKA